MINAYEHFTKKIKPTKTSGNPSTGKIQATPLHASPGGQKWMGGWAKSERCLATDHWEKNWNRKKIRFYVFEQKPTTSSDLNLHNSSQSG